MLGHGYRTSGDHRWTRFVHHTAGLSEKHRHTAMYKRLVSSSLFLLVPRVNSFYSASSPDPCCSNVSSTIFHCTLRKNTFPRTDRAKSATFIITFCKHVRPGISVCRFLVERFHDNHLNLRRAPSLDIFPQIVLP